MDRIQEYITLAVAIHGVALMIVNLTPTPKDNAALDKYTRLIVRVYRAIEIAAGVISPKVKR